MSSPTARKTIQIELITPVSFQKSRTGTQTIRYRLADAWPTKISVGGGGKIRTVTITFTGSSLTRLNP